MVDNRRWKVRCPICRELVWVEGLGAYFHDTPLCGETVELRQEDVLDYVTPGAALKGRYFARAAAPEGRAQRAKHQDTATRLNTVRAVRNRTGRKTCPLCRASVLLSNAVCPECMHPFTEPDLGRTPAVDGKELL